MRRRSGSVNNERIQQYDVAHFSAYHVQEQTEDLTDPASTFSRHAGSCPQLDGLTEVWSSGSLQVVS